MKKILFIMCLCTVTLSSCKKKYCWKCTLTVTTPKTGGGLLTTKTDADICDKTEAEIDDYEKDNSKTIDMSTQGNIKKETHTMRCNN